MPFQAPPGWSLRLIDLLGARPDEAEEEDLARLVSGNIREDADLDFKQERYGNTDQQRRALAGDIAAMANDRGGLLIIGIRDEKDVAVELTPVELVDGEEARIRQIAASNITPHIAFDIRIVSSSDQDPARGYYLLIVPPSSLRPHAVRKDRDLRYPRRDGPTTRWLSEPEVADMYRNRFSVATDQATRVGRALDDGLAVMNLTGSAFLAVTLVPTGPGSLSIDVARVAAVEEWAKNAIGPALVFQGFFNRQTPPAAGVGAHRITLTSIYETDKPPSWQYVELHDDGAGFAATQLPDPRTGWSGGERPGVWITHEGLLYELARSLLLLGRHAAENCGAWGDALVEARVVGEGMHLAYLDPHGYPDEIRRGRELSGDIPSRHTLAIDGIARAAPPLLAATRLVATDHFHAFGSPEVRHITPDGRIRIGYFRSEHRQLREWAERHGIEVTEETVAGE